MHNRRFAAILCAAIAVSGCQGTSGGGPIPLAGNRRVLSSVSDTYSQTVSGDAPTAYYRLDDSTRSAADSSANGFTATVGTSVTESVTGLLTSSSDTAMTLPGSGGVTGSIVSPQNTSMQPAGAISVEMWLRFAAVPADGTVVLAYEGNTAGAPPYELFFQGGKLIAQFAVSGANVQVASPSALSANTTYHAVATYDGTNARLYLNGTQVAVTAQSGTLSGYGSGSTFEALVQQSAPVQYFELEENAGPSAANAGSSGTAGTYAGNVTFGLAGPLQSEASSAIGLPGNSANTGMNTGVSVPNAATSGSFTTEDWVYPVFVSSTPVNSYYTIWGYDGAHRLLASNPAGKLLAQFGSNFFSAGALRANAWNQVCFVFDASAHTATLYINGVKDSSAAPAAAAIAKAYYLGQYDASQYYKFDGRLAQHIVFPSALPASVIANHYAAATGSAAAGLVVGADLSSNAPAFAGTVDEVAVYAGKALTAAQVQSHYTAGTSGSPPPTPSPTPSAQPNFVRTGTISALRANQFQVQFGTGCGYDWVSYTSATQFEPATAVPAVGQLVTVTATGTCSATLPAAFVAFPQQIAAPAYTDWNTFGNSIGRMQYNGSETTVSSANVASLHALWAANLGSAITAQPLVATNVSIAGSVYTVLYVGAENGMFYALDAATGKTLWHNQLKSISSACLDLPGGTFGVSGTATYDKATNRVYVADANNDVHALNMQTGQELPGWPVNIAAVPTDNHVYGALTYNPGNGRLYAETGSFCDYNTWQGRISAIDSGSASIVNTFYPASPAGGGGIWGLGGAAIDPAGNVFVAVGNASVANQAAGYSEQVVQLDENANVLASNFPSVAGNDRDFGATPMLYQPGSCGLQFAVKNKDGDLYLYNAGSVSAGAVQTLAMAPSSGQGRFVGVTAYSPVTNLVYVGNPDGNATFAHGIDALRVQSDCTLAPAWQQQLGGTPPTISDNDTPLVANDVVYLSDGNNKIVYALDAASGTVLWSSGALIHGSVLDAPTVDGRVFVPSWDHYLYAFGL